jgi:predicted enzyme related to lactoylglutathione lyase
MSLKDAPLFASLPAHDIERAKRWYEEKLELTPMLDMGVAGLIYRTAGSQWLIYPTPAAGTGKQTVGGFVVPDIDETMRDLRAKGVTYEDYAMGDEGPTTENGVARDPSGGASAWFKDSEGNILAVTQLPPGMSMSGDVA